MISFDTILNIILTLVILDVIRVRVISTYLRRGIYQWYAIVQSGVYWSSLVHVLLTNGFHWVVTIVIGILLSLVLNYAGRAIGNGARYYDATKRR